jgi:hypothetical protein
MNRVLLMCTVVVSTAILLGSCKSDEESASQGEGVISGTVTDVGTGAPLAGVSVQAQGTTAATQTTVTDAQGVFRFTFETDSSKIITLSYVRSGYRDTISVVQISPGTVTPVVMRLSARSPISGGSGGVSNQAQTIAFLGANPRELTVYGVGGLETSILGFEVRDSLGLPIGASSAVNISFSITNGPNGGEYISPLVVQTNQVGQAFTTFNSGIRSGVVQVLATTTVQRPAPLPPLVISSSPIRIVIHAGYPDQAHFTIGPDRHNFATLDFAFGLRDRISVLVGDKYSNPVAANTALYFRSIAGVMVASTFTGPTGEGSADLISGNPQPLGVYATTQYGNGYHYVVARTVGEGGISVTDSTLMLWSGIAIIDSLTPGTFSIPNAGSQIFTFKVHDRLNHPLASGTTIRVTPVVPPPPCPDCPINQVHSSFGAAGSGAVTLEDNLFPGPGVTDFQFILSDGSSSIIDTTAVTVNITVTGPNGTATASVSGTVR